MYKILIVEDNPEVMEALSDTLELADFPVKRAYDGEEALEILKEEEFDFLRARNFKMHGFHFLQVEKFTKK